MEALQWIRMQVRKTSAPQRVHASLFNAPLALPLTTPSTPNTKPTRMLRTCSSRHGDRRLTIRQKSQLRLSTLFRQLARGLQEVIEPLGQRAENARMTSPLALLSIAAARGLQAWPIPKNRSGRSRRLRSERDSTRGDGGRLLHCGTSAGLMPASGRVSRVKPVHTA